MEDEAFATLEYANGAHGYLYASTTEVPNHNMLEICGDRGKIVLHGSTLKHYSIDGSIREFTTANTADVGQPGVKEIPVELPPAPDARRARGHHANFARAILHGEPLIAPGEEGLNAVELINGMILSGKSGKTVSCPSTAPNTTP